MPATYMRSDIRLRNKRWIKERNIFGVPMTSLRLRRLLRKLRIVREPYLKLRGSDQPQLGYFESGETVFCNIWSAQSQEPCWRSAVAVWTRTNCRKSLPLVIAG